MISFELIRDAAEEVYRKATCDTREETIEALNEALAREESPAAKLCTEVILDVIKTSKEKGLAVCSDTGLPLYRVKVGSEVAAEVPKDITKAIQEGFADWVKKFPMGRGGPYYGLVQAVTFKELPPPVIHYDFLPGEDYLEIGALPKGTGSTPYSAADVFNWELGLVKKYVVDCVWKAGPRACPPYVVGVGIGGELETATILATDALMRPINERNPNPDVAKLEEELLGVINEFGIGPMGVGGKTTALAVNIEVTLGALRGSKIMGYLPVSVLVNCWPCRWAKARIYEDGRVEYV